MTKLFSPNAPKSASKYFSRFISFSSANSLLGIAFSDYSTLKGCPLRVHSLSVSLTLFFRKCQMQTQTGKSSGKTPAQPSLDRLRFYYCSTESMGQQAIDYENRKGHGHEDAA